VANDDGTVMSMLDFWDEENAEGMGSSTSGCQLTSLLLYIHVPVFVLAATTSTYSEYRVLPPLTIYVP
jgi:hypothetical protein